MQPGMPHRNRRAEPFINGAAVQRNERHTRQSPGQQAEEGRHRQERGAQIGQRPGSRKIDAQMLSYRRRKAPLRAGARGQHARDQRLCRGQRHILRRRRQEDAQRGAQAEFQRNGGNHQRQRITTPTGRFRQAEIGQDFQHADGECRGGGDEEQGAQAGGLGQGTRRSLRQAAFGNQQREGEGRRASAQQVAGLRHHRRRAQRGAIQPGKGGGRPRQRGHGEDLRQTCRAAGAGAGEACTGELCGADQRGECGHQGSERQDEDAGAAQFRQGEGEQRREGEAGDGGAAEQAADERVGHEAGVSAGAGKRAGESGDNRKKGQGRRA